MTRMRLRHVAAWVTGALVFAGVLACLAAFASLSPNGGDRDLPLGWWVTFGLLALLCGCAAAWLVHALLRRNA